MRLPPAAVLHYSGPVPPRRTMPPLSRIVGRPLNTCSLACLRLGVPQDIDTFRAAIEALCQRYSYRTVTARLDDLHARGYLTNGCPRHGFLTDKGRAALARFS